MMVAGILMSLAFCVDKFEVFDTTQIQIVAGKNSCYLTVHPRNAFQTMIYRDFLFDSTGLFMVFNSFGPGQDREQTGAREFRFFPRGNGDLYYKYDAGTRRLAVTAPSGKVFVFDTTKSTLVSVSGSQISQISKVHPSNKGGVEIASNDGLFFDGGFAQGHSPRENAKDKVIFKDSQGRSCQLANGDVYTYTSNGDGFFKFDDAQLESFLQNRCANLKF